MTPFPPDAVHETPESRLRSSPTDAPEYGLGSWPKVKERRRWGAFYRQIMPSIPAEIETRRILDYDHGPSDLPGAF